MSEPHPVDDDPDEPEGCGAIIGESVKHGDTWPTPDFCRKPGTYWRGPNSLRASVCCPDHEPTNPEWFRVPGP